ncbi:MAG: serine hydrolase domain-containing protein [Bacteroidota bacterium]
MKRLIYFSLMLISLIGFTACEKGPFGPGGKLAPATPIFSMDLFENNLKEALDGKAVGYAFTIGLNGQLERSAGYGFARTEADGLPQTMNIDQRTYMASVSKTITAATAMSLIQELNLSIDDPVAPYLPSHWSKGPGVNNLTFTDLLTHRSGLPGEGASYESLKAYVAQGLGPKSYDYANSNFALFRILIPYMEEAIPDDLTTDSMIESMTADEYVNSVNKRVLQPAKVSKAYCYPARESGALLYRHPYDGTQGDTPGNRTLLAGGGGWYLSARELGSVIAYLEFTEDILDEDIRIQMKENFLGYEEGASSSSANDHGTYLMKNGGFSIDSQSPSRGVVTCIADFPNGVQVALIINSRNSEPDGSPNKHPHVYTLMRDAFDNAFE